MDTSLRLPLHRDRNHALLQQVWYQRGQVGNLIIAQRVGASLDAVHKALYRLRDRLQECIEQRLAAAEKGVKKSP